MGPTQRYPRGLLELFGLKGVSPPAVLADFYQGTLDVMQLLGNTQRQTRTDAANAAAAEGASIGYTVPASEYWVLFSAAYLVVKTATMTALRMSIAINPGGTTFFSNSEGPFGATETGTISNGIFLPYPKLLFPGDQIRVTLEILGTDATANIGATVGIGVLA